MAQSFHEKQNKTEESSLDIIGIFLEWDDGLQDSWSRLSQVLGTNPHRLLVYGSLRHRKGESTIKMQTDGPGLLCLPPFASSLGSVTSSSRREWAPDQPLYFPLTRYLRFPYLTTKIQLEYAINVSLGQDQKKTRLYIYEFSKIG